MSEKSLIMSQISWWVYQTFPVFLSHVRRNMTSRNLGFPSSICLRKILVDAQAELNHTAYGAPKSYSSHEAVIRSIGAHMELSAFNSKKVVGTKVFNMNRPSDLSRLSPAAKHQLSRRRPAQPQVHLLNRTH